MSGVVYSMGFDAKSNNIFAVTRSIVQGSSLILYKLDPASLAVKQLAIINVTRDYKLEAIGEDSQGTSAFNSDEQVLYLLLGNYRSDPYKPYTKFVVAGIDILTGNLVSQTMRENVNGSRGFFYDAPKKRHVGVMRTTAGFFLAQFDLLSGRTKQLVSSPFYISPTVYTWNPFAITLGPVGGRSLYVSIYDTKPDMYSLLVVDLDTGKLKVKNDVNSLDKGPYNIALVPSNR